MWPIPSIGLLPFVLVCKQRPNSLARRHRKSSWSDWWGEQGFFSAYCRNFSRIKFCRLPTTVRVRHLLGRPHSHSLWPPPRTSNQKNNLINEQGLFHLTTRPAYHYVFEPCAPILQVEQILPYVFSNHLSTTQTWQWNMYIFYVCCG